MPIKTFKGKLASGEQQTIRLATNQGLMGYKVIKFQIVDSAPGTADVEMVAKLFSIDPPTIDATINFDDPTLMGVVVYTAGNVTTEQSATNIIFDNTTVNQDMFITGKDVGGGNVAMNYYIELEQVKLDLNEATVATLKDMRARYITQDP